MALKSAIHYEKYVIRPRRAARIAKKCLYYVCKEIVYCSIKIFTHNYHYIVEEKQQIYLHNCKWLEFLSINSGEVEESDQKWCIKILIMNYKKLFAYLAMDDS